MSNVKKDERVKAHVGEMPTIAPGTLKLTRIKAKCSQMRSGFKRNIDGAMPETYGIPITLHEAEAMIAEIEYLRKVLESDSE